MYLADTNDPNDTRFYQTFGLTNTGQTVTLHDLGTSPPFPTPALLELTFTRSGMGFTHGNTNNRCSDDTESRPPRLGWQSLGYNGASPIWLQLRCQDHRCMNIMILAIEWGLGTHVAGIFGAEW